MTKTELTKRITSVIVGIGTARIVRRTVENNVPIESTTDKVTITAGTWALGGIAADATKKYTDDFIDKIVKAVSDIKEATNTSDQQ